MMADTTLVDPLGRTVVLHDATWYGHIIKRHGELAPHRKLVERAIRDPLEIRFSTSDPDCRKCYGNGPRGGIMIVVVIDVVAEIVKTAYLANRMTGAVEWSPPTP
jgi:hypothetical protein